MAQITVSQQAGFQPSAMHMSVLVPGCPETLQAVGLLVLLLLLLLLQQLVLLS
jgi:hypothetical protein